MKLAGSSQQGSLPLFTSPVALSIDSRLYATRTELRPGRRARAYAGLSVASPLGGRLLARLLGHGRGRVGSDLRGPLLALGGALDVARLVGVAHAQGLEPLAVANELRVDGQMVLRQSRGRGRKKWWMK